MLRAILAALILAGAAYVLNPIDLDPGAEPADLDPAACVDACEADDDGDPARCADLCGEVRHD
jgi:hypothetical protein